MKKNAFTINRRSLLKLSTLGFSSVFSGIALADLSPVSQSTEETLQWSVPLDSVEQTATWMAFPHTVDTPMPVHIFSKMQKDWALVCRTIAKYQPVFVICGKFSKQAKKLIGETHHPVTYISNIANDSMWIRDFGCVFRANGLRQLEAINLHFNGWGGQKKLPNDALVATKMAQYLNIPVTNSITHGEGGAVIYDGDGTLIANWSSWTGHNRNPGKSKEEVAAGLLAAYGAQKMIWGTGIIGKDITDAGIDVGFRFIKPGVIAVHRPSDTENDIWSSDERRILEILKKSTDAKNRSFEFVYFDEPQHPRYNGKDAENTYLNYLVVNGAVLTANFGDKATDLAARKTFEKAYPGRVIEMLPLDTLYGYGDGGIHSITQQQPTCDCSLKK